MKRIDRLEMNALSLQVFGSSSKWQKLTNTGVLTPKLDEDKEPIVVSIDRQGGAHYMWQMERNSPYKIKEFMLVAKAAILKGEAKKEEALIQPAPSVLNKLKGLFKRKR